MRITSVKVSNWRNFKTLEFEMGNRLFIVGPNASGKSNVLDAFRFLAEVAGAGGLATAVAKRGGYAKVRSLFARNHEHGRIVFDIHLANGDDMWRYRLAVRAEERGFHRPIVDEERVERNGVRVLVRPDSKDRADPERLTQTHLEQIAANQDFRAIAEYFVKGQYFHLVPQVIRNPGAVGLEAGDEYGADFIARMNAVPAKTRDAWLRRIQSALRAAVPEFESLRLEVDSAGRPHLVAGYKNWRQMPTKQSEADFSDGTLRLIGLLWTLVSMPANGGVLLLEEPELSLNSAIVRLLPTMLATAQRDRNLQVVLSTHAPELLDDEGIRPSEILVLRVTDDGSRADRLSDIREVQGQVAAGLPTSRVVESLITPGDLTDLATAAVGRPR